MTEQFLKDIYEGYIFDNAKQLRRGLEVAIPKLTLKEMKRIEDSSNEEAIGLLRKILGEKYENEIVKEIDFIENNLTEENEWDMIYLMNLHEFYVVI